MSSPGIAVVSLRCNRFVSAVGDKADSGSQSEQRIYSSGREHDPEKACPALDAGWVPVFPPDKREAFARRSCSNKKIERDDDSKKSHPALGTYHAGRGCDGVATPASRTARMPVRKMPSKVPAPPIEATGAPRPVILSRLRRSAPMRVPIEPPI